MLRDLYGADVLTTTVPIGADFKEAVALRRPIVHHKPRGASAKAIQALGDELLGRVAYTVQAAARGGRVMDKAKDILSRFGSNLAESMGAGRRPGRRDRAGDAGGPLPARRHDAAEGAAPRSTSTGSRPTPTSPGRSSTRGPSTGWPRASGRTASCSPSRSGGARTWGVT